MTTYGYPPAGQMPPQNQPYPQAQPYPQQPPAPQGYPTQGPSPYAAQAAPQGPQQGVVQGLPQWHEVDDEAARQAYAQTSQTGNFGPTPQFLKVPGPRGQLTWDSTVPKGTSASIHIRLMPPWAQGKPIFVESRTLFYKSNKYPRGRVLGFQGQDSLYMQAISAAANSGDPRLQKIATEYGRVRTQYLYNVLDLTHPESHTGQDGVMRPYLLGAGGKLHREIGEIGETRGGISRIVSPLHGRPFKFTKTKNGVDTMNVEYGVVDLDPEPLHAYFGAALSNLWDLEQQILNPSQDEVLEAIRELGLPNPQQTTVQVPAGYPTQQPMAYSPDPNPPHVDPYAQQPAQQQPVAYPPAQQPMQQQPGAYPPAQVPIATPPLPQYGGQAPQMQGQQYGAGVGGVPPPIPGQAGAPPIPGVSPPPVQSNPQAAPAYPVQAGGMGQPPF